MPTSWRSPPAEPPAALLSPLKLLIVAVGHTHAGWVDAGFEEYAKRMPREARSS